MAMDTAILRQNEEVIALELKVQVVAFFLFLCSCVYVARDLVFIFMCCVLDLPRGGGECIHDHAFHRHENVDLARPRGGGARMGVACIEGKKNDAVGVVSVVSFQVSEIMKKAEAKGEEGEVDEAQELFQQAEELQQQKAGLEAKALQVCRVLRAPLLLLLLCILMCDDSS